MIRTGVAAALIGLLGCSPAAEASAEPAPDDGALRDVSVDWENRSEDVHTVTFAQNGALVGTGNVFPCEAGGMGIQMAEPFKIGVTAGGGAPGAITEPGAEVADSTTWPQPGEGFVTVLIAPDGTVTVEVRDERITPAEEICP